MKITALWALCLIVCMQLPAQTRVVYGKLTAFNQYPLKNIEVAARKSKAAVRSDSLGIFSIVCNKRDVIKIKPKAFVPVSRSVDSGTDTLYINLVFVDNKSNREIATGYGYINEDDLSFAVSHMQQENNEFCNYNDIYELIRGRFPGVQVSHYVGGGAVYIRGINSINLNTEALYVVDGVITDNLGFVHPCDVASIDVLKDGQAAIYGARGGGGVVVVETKKGF